MGEELSERKKELKELLSALGSKLLLGEISEEKYTELKKRYEEELEEVNARITASEADIQLKRFLLFGGVFLICVGAFVYAYTFIQIWYIESEISKGAPVYESELYSILKTANIISLLALFVGAVLSFIEIVKYERGRSEYKRKWTASRAPDETRELLAKLLQRKGAKVSASPGEIKAKLPHIKIFILVSGTKDRTELQLTLQAPKKIASRYETEIKPLLDEMRALR